MLKFLSLASLVVLIGFSAGFVARAQESAPAAPLPVDPEAPPEPVEAPATQGNPDDVPAGHSFHGEAFNEGPRQAAYLMGTTGKIQFPATTKNPAAKKFVEQGIGQLHGFWYFEAERSFRQAAMLDPDCAIAYWGMAMANVNNQKRAKAFLCEAIERKAKAGPLEVRFIEALDDQLNGKGDNKEKAKREVETWQKIFADFPIETEAHAFYGYFLWKHRAEVKREYEDVEKVLNDLLAREPMHPVHHYRIHLWDHKDAAKALNSSALCGQAAPGIAHMWHMPGHIYSQVMRYEDAVWQQEASARVDHAHMMRDRVMPDQIHNFAHNNEWLIRNLNYIGRWQAAIDLAKNMTELPQHPNYNTQGRHGSTHFGRLRLIETLTKFEQWAELVRLADQPYLEPTEVEAEQVKRLKFLGVAHARLNQPDKAREIIAQLETRRTAALAQAKAKEEQEQKKREEEARKKYDERLKELERRRTDPDRPPDPDEDPERPPEPDEPFEAPPPPKPTGASPTAELDKAIAAIQGHLDWTAGDFKAAHAKLKTADEDTATLARLQSLAGEHDAAIKAINDFLNSQKNRVQPLAAKIEILWKAGKKDEARQAFDALRAMSNSIQFGSPVFDRLKPIAAELGFPDDWRVAHPTATDVGQRPCLDDLGPFRWRPMPAPDWTLQDANGQPFTLAQFRGKPVVAIFYLGYGCLHCAEQLKTFAPMTEKFRAAGIELIAVSTDDPKGLKQSLDNYPGGMPFPLVSNDSLEVFKAYRCFDDFENKTLHGTFVIDARGFVRWQDIGYQPFMDANFVLKEAQRQLAIDAAAPQPELALTTPAVPAAPTLLDEASATAALHAIRIGGISGSLILSGAGNTPDNAIHTFVDLARRQQARIVVLQSAAADGEAACAPPTVATLPRLLARWTEHGGASFQVFRVSGDNAAGESEMLATLGRATALWCDGGSRGRWSKLLKEESLGRQCTELLGRGGVIGGSAEFSAAVSAGMFAGDQEPTLATGGLDWLPSAVIDTASSGGGERLLAALAQQPLSVGYRLPPGSALIVRERHIRAVGDAPVSIHFANSPAHAAKSLTLSDKQRDADLTALRRIAIQRRQPAFPVEKPDAPNVASGSLIIVGGGGMPDGLLGKFVELAGGKEASIVVIPISTPEPLPANDPLAESLKQAGAKEVTVLRGRTPAEVDSTESLDALRKATGVWFGGGRQWRFIDAYEGTQAAALMHDVLKRGGVIAGSSAGASIQGEYMARGNPLGPEQIMADGYERGLCFLRGTAIDQHFTQRNRLPDLASLVDRYPQYLGIGIDESTAIIVRGSVAEVVGKHRVCFYDRRQPVVAGQPDYLSVPAGGKFDLMERKIITAQTTTSAAAN